MGGRRKASRIAWSRVKGAGNILRGGFDVMRSSVSIGGVGTYRKGLSRARSGGRSLFGRSVRGTGSGGAQKGHPFYGNQYTKVAKYSRKKSSRGGKKRRLHTWKGK
jgi:hypothetical protein